METFTIIKDFLKKENVQAVLICLILGALAFTVQTQSGRFMEDSSVKVLEPLDKADSIQNQVINASLSGSSVKISTLKKQYLMSEQVKRYYRQLGTTYYVNYYSFSICAIVFATLLTVAVFLMVNKGWQNSGLLLKTFLLANIVLSSVYYFLPNVLSNKDNINSNMLKIKEFQKIQSDIMKIAVNAGKLDEKKMDSAIQNHFERIGANIDFPTTIDNSKIDSKLLKLLETDSYNK
ncbi:hypothetical protein CQ046_13485 [Chryseobacterium sp. MYb7]|uniref:hypothetical protein n=1 Tax=Chryseobacterium sp. MYb7 TaxID=1827290 RepID=UPI000CFFCCE3|nr:hypothetical protein [Chryseobacterium sp. MYb7]PRB02247.1 hypothetical protein CQ046_13485 [Chryseobacterium sp. MYb7]